jgi:hypothetical protein
MAMSNIQSIPTPSLRKAKVYEKKDKQGGTSSTPQHVLCANKVNVDKLP